MVDHLLFSTQLGDGKPLLLIHGLLMDGRMFAPLIAHLAHSQRLIIPDLRAHGQSRQLPPPYTVTQHADDLISLLDAHNIEATDVLGYSQGGAVAQELARRYPDRVTRLFLVCTYAHNMLSVREKIEGRVVLWLVRLLPMSMIGGFIASQAEGMPQEPARTLREMITFQDKAQALASIREMQQFDSQAWLSELRCPTHIVAGSADTAVPMHHAKMLRRGIPHSTLHVIEDAGHMLVWTHAAELAAEIASASRSG